MDGIIELLRGASSFEQALGVSVGGLVGVFATLAFFFIMIVAADHFGKH
jgi:hypothetical protein